MIFRGADRLLGRSSEYRRRRTRAIAAATLAASAIPGLAIAAPVCLPDELFPKDYEYTFALFDLGLVGGAPTLCAPNVEMSPDFAMKPVKPGYLACYGVDPASGALSTSAVTALPGHSQNGAADAHGCVDGYCPEPRVDSDATVLWADSTDGARRVIRNGSTLHVFETGTKKQTSVIQLFSSDSPDNTSVSNEPVKLIYAGHTIYVVGSDAGPYMAVWAFGDDGSRKGVIRSANMTDEESGGYSVYNGTASLIDDGHVALGDFGIQSMIVIDTGSGAQQENKRAADISACTSEEMQSVNYGDYEVRQGSDGYSGVSAKCHDAVVKNLESYFDISPVRLSSGDLLAALSGKHRGEIAVLDAKTLAIKSRHRLARCSK